MGHWIQKFNPIYIFSDSVEENIDSAHWVYGWLQTKNSQPISYMLEAQEDQNDDPKYHMWNWTLEPWVWGTR